MMEEIEGQIVGFMRDRVAAMGPGPSGAHNFYVSSLERGQIYNAYERFIFTHLMSAKPRSVVHAGVGIGSFIAALTAAGIKCLGYEMEPSRFAAAVALREHLRLNYELREAGYPDWRYPVAEMLLFTNVAAGWDTATEDKVIGTFGRFERVLFSPRSFGRDRPEAADQDALMERIAVTSPTAVPCPGYGYAYIDARPVRTGPKLRAHWFANLTAHRSPNASMG